MGAFCSRQSTSQDDALLAAIRDGDDDTVREQYQEYFSASYVLQRLANSRLVAQPSKYFAWAAQVSALHGASNEGHLGVLEALVEAARPNCEATARDKQSFKAFLNRCNSYGQTPLMLACKNGGVVERRCSVAMLLRSTQLTEPEPGIISERTAEGARNAHQKHMILCRHIAMVKYLLGAGADPLVPDKVHSRTCLHYAAWNEECRVRLHNGLIGGAHEAIVNDACGTSKMVDMRSESGFTPLHFAVSASNAAAVKALLDKGASLTAEVLQGACYSIWPTHSTPLHIAAAKGSASVVRHILQAQVNSNRILTDLRLSRDANGKRPIDVARQLQFARLEHMLDPFVPLQQAILPQRSRSSRSHGCLSLVVLAGKAVQVSLMGQLDFLAWQLRLRDGAAAAMPRSLKRQLMKSSKSAKALCKHHSARPTQPSTASAPTEVAESQVSTDSEDREVAGADSSGAGSTTVTTVEVAGDTEVSSAPAVEAEDMPPPPSPGERQGPGGMSVASEVSQASQMSHEESSKSLAVDEPATKEHASDECGVCLDRQTQLLIGDCLHECCYDCAITLVKKTKLTKSSIRCPFCRGIIGTFHLKEKENRPIIMPGK